MASRAKQMALGGILAALAVVIMSMGGLIPVATYICPMLCIVLLQAVLWFCGIRITWAWYGAVTILGLLMGPDKEAAAVFAFLGYYPIIKPRMDQLPLKWLWKLLLFNVSMVVLYCILIRIMGLEAVTGESEALGSVMLLVLLVLGNVTFLALDRLLSLVEMRLRRKR